MAQDNHITLPPISSFDNLIRAATEQDFHGGAAPAAHGRGASGGGSASESLLSYQLSNVSRTGSMSGSLSPDHNNYFMPFRHASLDGGRLGGSQPSSVDGSPSLKAQLGLPHGTGAKVYKTNKPRKKKECPVCHNFYANLSTHKSTHLDPEARPHKCDICSRGFARSNDLQRHKKRHWKDEFSPSQELAKADGDEQQQQGAGSKLESSIPTEQLKSLHMIQGTYKCPFNSTLIKLDMEIYPTKGRRLAFETSNCHITGVFSRCDTYKNHLKALHFEYPPGTKKRERAKIHGRCKHCGMKFDNVDMWLNEHVGKVCGYFYH
ncbi:AFR588Wp [Eremothecium gossypii ATCC 10895]|uniref:AFR588Wp n=1 Tax=Eremothecium gossypii (strain ATCC 10895 / CBS 109.51 / FGSC 9923 / NRRL Y-1056) TaxID=284811 RepID=Q752I7_EREGS|nr:AFR588Wp [Eremothecium gossypii ATCC 10895]AAS53959.1 AFR588Wp [Eremothecium gossypii ATCC 10895]AEY98272.1 FAFR588Wp [Eremothecium gossypii FDAG1]